MEPTDAPIRVIVAPGDGRLRLLPPRRFRAGTEWVEEGEPVLKIEHEGRVEVILAPVDGRMGGVLGRDGDRVTAGQPVAWIETADGTEP